VLTIANEALHRAQANNDPLKDFKIYGTIYNPHVKRRKNYTAGEASKATPASESTSAVKSVLAQPAARASKPPPPPASTKPGPAKPAAPKPQATGALLSSFAKTRPPKPAAKKAAASPEQSKSATADADGKALSPSI
jgi:hypothetical protein